MKSKWIVTCCLAVVVALAGTASAKSDKAKKPKKTCDSTVVADTRAAIAEACPCDGKVDEESGEVTPWKNHGQYVKCVTKARKAEAKAAGLWKKCVKDVVPCAANSACGTSGAVACSVTTGVCLDDPTPGDGTAEGTCDTDGAPCDADADCAQSTCQVAESSTACSDIGGTAAGLECCE